MNSKQKSQLVSMIQRCAILTLCIASICFWVSCAKKQDVNPPTTTNNPPSNMDYFPLTKGSSWQYVMLEASNSSIYRYCTGNTLKYNGFEYSEIKEVVTDGTVTADTFYCSKQGSVYFTYATYDFQGGLFKYARESYRNDYIRINQSWTDTMKSAGFVFATFNSTVIDTGLTMVVQGKKYSGVVHYTCKVSDASGLNYTVDDYLTKGVGIIREENYKLKRSFELTAYTIK